MVPLMSSAEVGTARIAEHVVSVGSTFTARALMVPSGMGVGVGVEVGVEVGIDVGIDVGIRIEVGIGIEVKIGVTVFIITTIGVGVGVIKPQTSSQVFFRTY